uniref:Rieske domain-containing protein n=1 Tax=Leersia perrieri TaxID=77586 RepID=A0A0D9XMN9_9ORYZ
MGYSFGRQHLNGDHCGITVFAAPFALANQTLLLQVLLQKGIKVYAVLGDDEAENAKKNTWEVLFHVNDPGPRVPIAKGKFLDVNRALEMVQFGTQYCDWRARQDLLLTIMVLHNKVVEIFNPLARELKSNGTLRKELAELQEELAKAHNQVHLSETRASSALDKLAKMETLANDGLLQDGGSSAPTDTRISLALSTSSAPRYVHRKTLLRSLNVSGPVQSYNPSLKNFWYPVTFSSDLKDDTMVPIDLFEEQWVIFRGKDGRPGCVQNTCAHRACPLHLGSVSEGRIQCPFHGWEYSTDGKCEKMPATKMLNVRIRSLPCFEQDGMVWIWPGDDPPMSTIPSLLPPSGFTIHLQTVTEVPMEHGLLLDNLLDIAHAPFVHTSTFAKGWSVPSLVKFLTPSSGFQGYWDPYPIDMEFRPPCMVVSTVGISKPGKLEGKSTKQCSTHLHQLHICLPSSTNKTRLLYQMSLNFVLNEDLRLVLGQQERMINGANVWNWPVSYDKLGIRYRLWRNSIERGADRFPFNNESESGT